MSPANSTLNFSAPCVLPQFSHFEVETIIGELYGLGGGLTALSGERDLNFLLDTENSENRKFVFKICNLQESEDLMTFQAEVMSALSDSDKLQTVRPITSVNGRDTEKIISSTGELHLCRLTTYLEGSLFSSIKPHSEELLSHLGESLAHFNEIVGDLEATLADRPLLWILDGAADIVDALVPLIEDDGDQQTIRYFAGLFKHQVLDRAEHLPRSFIHNDPNDNNIVVENRGPWDQRVVGLIDFGDMVESWTVADLAIACAYAMLEKPRPLDSAVTILRGYHGRRPLSQIELAALFSMITMRLCLSVCICAKQKTLVPENEYLTISERPAWKLLRMLQDVPPDYAHYLFRDACGLEPVPCADAVKNWLQTATFSKVCDLGPPDALLLLDSSVSSPYTPASEDDYEVNQMNRQLFTAMDIAGADTGIGRYGEYRLIYDSDEFVDFTGHRRTLHLGIDIFQPAGSVVYAPLQGAVFGVSNNNSRFDYGGAMILRHDVDVGTEEPITFYTLYGHLAPGSIAHWRQGDRVEPGQRLARMGESAENGGWPPHLHFEIITDVLGQQASFVGVGSHAHRRVWLSLCPDPNLILGLPKSLLQTPCTDSGRIPGELLQKRSKVVSSALSLSYREPVSMARGRGQYLFDFTGRRFLDAVNNVPHVGHCHPHVVEAGYRASSVLSTNTRYLYPQLTDYAERLAATFPEPLRVVFLVNSGSEANDLAIRMARCRTGARDILALEHAYHGNLGSLIDISGYKHDGPGGQGAPDWVHKVPLPDRYRGRLQCDNPSSPSHWTAQLDRTITENRLDGRLAAFICESIAGCGGQIVLPEGYLKAAFERVRAAAGVCIVDEVQTGFGRVGSHFWAFQTQGVVPDIVTLGKPAGNGHPLGAVITTPEIAASFDNGMEYFNTFGGNPVSCAIGNAVLDVLESEQLQANALHTGKYLSSALKKAVGGFDLVGDIRGLGLFLGIELVRDRTTLAPAVSQAGYIAERMKQEGVLVSTDGPWHNVLKIKPPMVFNKSDADVLTANLQSILSETWAQP